MDEDLVDPDLSPDSNRPIQILSRQIMTPAWLIGFPPVMETEHNGEGAGGQQLLFVIVLLVLVIQAVGCRQCKSVANLRREVKIPLILHCFDSIVFDSFD